MEAGKPRNHDGTMVALNARPQEVEIDIQRTAIVVVDMQNAYASKGGMLDLGTGIDEKRIGPVIAANQRLLPAARAAGVKVIYLQFGYKPDLSDAGGPHSPNIRKQMAFRMIRERPQVRDKLIVEGTWGWQIIDQLKPEPGDLVVQKSRYSGFAGTTLESQLRGLDIRHLIFTGVATNVCVESTAREAYFREFWPILVEDAMDHTGPDFVRQATFYNFESKMGWVTRTEDVLRILKG
ncbi:MAG: cysteine hydrolase [Betaproteobacteria bacterium]|nr:cysteine hydrolase [Betaproteobacteria bacterium]